MAFVFLLVLSVFILVVGILGISLLFFLKNRKLKNVVFYFLVIWSMLIACLNATGLPTNYSLVIWIYINNCNYY
ncbi:hypothetical protein [Clostridium perfringens]|uniref:hypothetical protein n=1 Tax=Clostridium perfringens TaxID=1502 RepID=UPI000DF0F408|nr:hypothetical protein [Clostridium perfringens]MDT7932442.1 hypothetical protein [Clostridium perfringens]MDT7955990.1 hypothetical protein [Clostridium perfringens]STB60734.1 Uncharacterised protein [Clostridium perfringens]